MLEDFFFLGTLQIHGAWRAQVFSILVQSDVVAGCFDTVVARAPCGSFVVEPLNAHRATFDVLVDAADLAVFGLCCHVPGGS